MTEATEPTEPIEDYLGDGVYVEFTGYSILLKANDRLYPTGTVHLEPSVLVALNRFAARVGIAS